MVQGTSWRMVCGSENGDGFALLCLGVVPVPRLRGTQSNEAGQHVPGSSLFQAGVRTPALGFCPRRFRRWSCGDRDRGDSRLPSPMLRWMFRKSARRWLDMYLPHRVAAWYSSAGMDRNIPVFIGGALWVCSWETPFSRHQCIQDNRAGVR